jgi:radical SAM protein with 4Fe4S-binding SPASM domain
MNSLLTVELNITELCNRTCEFCPRADSEIYPNRKLMMAAATVEKAVADLGSFGYKGRLSFSGYGEPLLHPGLSEFVGLCRRALPGNTIEVNTNGDYLSVENTRALFESGLTQLYINLYDGESQRAPFISMMTRAGVEASRYRLRDHWVGASKEFGLNLNNRSGMVDLKIEGVRRPAELVGLPCYYPFYRLMLDWNGDMLFCSNDWGREIVVGNIHQRHVKELWLSAQMTEIRRRLGHGDRRMKPCGTCNVVGTLYGRPSVDLLMSHDQDSSEGKNP